LDFPRELGEEKALELYKRTGAPLHSAYAIAQLRAFYKSNSDSVSKVSQWKSICSLLLDRWTARDDTPISYSEASWCGLLNYGTCDYDDLALDLLPDACTNALPKLADFDEVPFLNEGISQRTSYWERWPLLRGSRLFLGLGDGACANIGSKCSVPNRIACTVGTSAAARVCLPCPIGLSESLNFEAGLFCYRIDRSHILLGGALNDGGNAVEWIRQLLNLQTDESFDECLKAVSLLTESDCNKGSSIGTPTLIPFLSGERSTGFRTRATGAMIDLTHATTPAHMLKSVLEGVTLRLNAIVARICQTSKSLHQSTASILVVSGKALEVNDIWRQMLANCSGIKVVFDKATQEGTSRGVAVLITRAIQQSRDRDARLYLPGETISNALIEEPVDALRGYWKHISNRQEKLLYAISDMYD
jgi:gluconokinase